MLNRRALLTLLGSLVPAKAWAQPGDALGKKITMIVGFAPGGGVDVLARVVAQELNDHAGYQVVIENRPGAGSNIAAKIVAGAAPDGQRFCLPATATPSTRRSIATRAMPLRTSARSRSRRSTAKGSRSMPPIREDPGRFRQGGKGQAAELRLRRLVVAHHRRICAQGDGEDRSDGRAVPERRAARSMRYWAITSTSSPRRLPNSCRRRSRARCACSPSAAPGGPRRSPTCQSSPKPASPASKSTAGSASWRPPRRPMTSAQD